MRTSVIRFCIHTVAFLLFALGNYCGSVQKDYAMGTYCVAVGAYLLIAYGKEESAK